MKREPSSWWRFESAGIDRTRGRLDCVNGCGGVTLHEAEDGRSRTHGQSKQMDDILAIL